MRELYITLTCLSFFFPCFSFHKTTAGKKNAGAGSRVGIKRGQGAEQQAVLPEQLTLWLPRGSLQASWENCDSPEGADKTGWEDSCPQTSSSTTLAATLAVSRVRITRGSCLEAWSSGAREKGGGGKGRHRTVSSIGAPLGTIGPQWPRAVRALPCWSANQLLQEGLQLVLVLDAHKLVHHVPVLDG